MTKYIDADIFVTHCCNSCIKNGVSCCPTVDSCDYIEDLQAFLVDAPAAADRLEQQEQRITELEREIAAAKADLHHNDACSVCIGADQEVCKDCDIECQTCVLDCRCKDCWDESKWEWRGPQEAGEESR